MPPGSLRYGGGIRNCGRLKALTNQCRGMSGSPPNIRITPVTTSGATSVIDLKNIPIVSVRPSNAKPLKTGVNHRRNAR
jgi:hypothetical protein